MSIFKNPPKQTAETQPDGGKPQEISTENVKRLIGMSSDVDIRTIRTGADRSLTVTFVYIDGMVDTPVIDENILEPLQYFEYIKEISSYERLYDGLITGLIPHNAVRPAKDLADCVDSVLFGFGLIIFDSLKSALLLDLKGFEKRSVSENTNENVLKGGKDAFIEIIRTNTALVRTRLISDKLRIIEMQKGEISKNPVALVYIEGTADPKVVESIKKKLESITCDNLITSSFMEDMLLESKRSLFPRVMYTERPDKFCANIAAGKVGIIINGLPTAYILPATINMFMQASEDYSYNLIIARMLRALRYIAVIVSMAIPAYYIAITTFHQEMIPRELAIAIIKSKEGVPFSTSVEVLFLLFAFELLIEAGIRMPNAVGTALSIVGAIVIGDAAVNAKLISTPVIVVISLAGIAGFAVTNQDFSNAVRGCRLILVIMASLAGLFGLIFGLLFILCRLSKYESFGVPYLYPDVSDKPNNSPTLVNIPIPLKRRGRKK